MRASTIRHGVLLAAGLAAAAVAGAAERDRDAAVPKIRLTPVVRLDGVDYLIGAEGMAQLPNGAVIQLSLIPAEESKVGELPLCSTRVAVSGGSFSLPSWTVKRATLRAVRYRLEARLAKDQTVAVPRLAAYWSASEEIPLGDWRAHCGRLTPLARTILERVAALAEHREELRDLAMRYAEKKGVSAGDWNGFKARSGMGRALAQCNELLSKPETEITYPQARIRVQNVVGQFHNVISGLDHIFSAEKRAVENPGAFEFWADFKNSPFARAADSSSFLGEVEMALAGEGSRHLVVALEEILVPLDPGTEEKPRLVKPEAVAAANKALAEFMGPLKAFFDIRWSFNVQDRQRSILEAVDAARKLAEEEKKELSPNDLAAGLMSRLNLWNDFRGRVTRLREALRREAGL